MKWLLAILISAVTVIVSSCTQPALRSKAMAGRQNYAAPRRGIVYYLPKARVRIDAVRADLKKTPAPADKPATDKPAPTNNPANPPKPNALFLDGETGLATRCAQDETPEAKNVPVAVPAEVQPPPPPPPGDPGAGDAAPAGGGKKSGSPPVGYEVTISVEILPDESMPFILTPQMSCWSSQYGFIAVTNGLLTSIVTTNADKTGDFIVEVAKIGIETFKLVAGGFPTGAPRAVGQGEPPREIHVSFDPENPAQIKIADETLQRANLRLVSGTVETKAGPDLPSTNGVYYRPLRPLEVAVQSKVDGSYFSKTVLIPNTAQTFAYDPRRYPFVQSVHNIRFDNGSIASIAMDKPSSSMAIISVPSKIISSIISIPTELFQLKVNYSSAEKALISAEKDKVNAMKDLLNAQRELIKTQNAEP